MINQIAKPYAYFGSKCEIGGFFDIQRDIVLT